jgi:hypothetical protein
MSKQLIERKERGRLIAQANGLVKRIGETSYTVSSQSGNGSYNVNCTEFGWTCSCPDSMYRGIKCKHIHARDISSIQDLRPIHSTTIFYHLNFLLKDFNIFV